MAIPRSLPRAPIASGSRRIPTARSACAALTALALGLSLSACSPASPKNQSLPKEDWRLIPEATILGERRQFFLYGRGLDSAKVAAPPSVEAETGGLTNGNRVLSVYLKVLPLRKDSLAAGEKPGSREIRFTTPDTTVAFTVKVVDEALPR